MSSTPRQIEIFRSAMAKATAVLAQAGVDVTQIGTGAYCQWDDATGKLKRINIPMIPSQATPEFLSAIQGYIDHEVAHALFTNARQLTVAQNSLPKATRQTASTLGNIVEDIRIEKAMVGKYAGSKHNISHLLGHLSEGWREKLDAAKASGDEQAYATTGFVPFLRGIAGSEDCAPLMAEYGLKDTYKDLLTAMPNLSARLNALKDTKEAYALGLEIMEAIKNPPQDDSDGDGDDASDSKPQDKGEGDGDAGGVGDQGNDKGGDSADDGEGQGGQSGQGDAEDAGGEAPTEQPEKGSGETPAQPGIGCALDIDLNNLKDTDTEMGEAVASQITEYAPKGEMFELTYDYDVIKPLEDISRIPDTVRHEKVEAEVSAATNAMAKHLKRLLVARAQSLLIGGYRRGRLNGPALHRFSTGDDRLFRKRQEHKDKAVAVSLLIDNSGSMSGNKLDLAMKAGYALAGTLHQLGIASEVLGFTTPKANTHPATILKISQTEMTSRIERGVVETSRALGIPASKIRSQPVIMPIYKSFGENFSIGPKRRMAHMIYSKGGGILAANNDATSIYHAGRRLLDRPEPRKVLIVISDGEPAASVEGPALQGSLKKNIKRLEEKGVEVFAIGAQSDSVSRYYEHYVVLQDINKLVETVIKKLSEFLLKK